MLHINSDVDVVNEISQYPTTSTSIYLYLCVRVSYVVEGEGEDEVRQAGTRPSPARASTEYPGRGQSIRTCVHPTPPYNRSNKKCPIKLNFKIFITSNYSQGSMLYKLEGKCLISSVNFCWLIWELIFCI